MTKATLLPEKQLRRVLEKTCYVKQNYVYFFKYTVDGEIFSFSNYLFDHCLEEVDISIVEPVSGFGCINEPSNLKGFFVLKNWFIPNSFKE
jgi:hypothetical protein